MAIVPVSKLQRRRIPLTPLIDMVFTLLLFFILTTRFSELDQVELNVSHSAPVAAKKAGELSSTLRIRLRKEVVQIGDSLFSYGKVMVAVQRYFPGYSVVIEAEEGVSVQQVVAVLDAVKLAGATEITLKDGQ